MRQPSSVQGRSGAELRQPSGPAPILPHRLSSDMHNREPLQTRATSSGFYEDGIRRQQSTCTSNRWQTESIEATLRQESNNRRFQIVEINPDTGRQVHHDRTASSTRRRVAASTPLAIRSRSPFPSTNSSVESATAAAAGFGSRSANSTESGCRNRLPIYKMNTPRCRARDRMAGPSDRWPPARRSACPQ